MAERGIEHTVGRSMRLSGYALLLLAAPLRTSSRPRQRLGRREADERGAFHQRLPDCSQGFPRIRKRTSAKAILCPMVRDEEGFLSEWVGYYQMHGFDHVMVFDDGSTDRSLVELRPWIDAGFVSVRSNWTTESLGVNMRYGRGEFDRAMAIKALLERDCKLQAIAWGYEYMYSLDIDEYVIPKDANTTIVDELHETRLATNRSMLCARKHNFVQTPHTLEPVHLLTIEAYQHRNVIPGKMNYYTSVMPKCAYVLQQPTAELTAYVAQCCFFHGCDGQDRSARHINLCYSGVLSGAMDRVRKGNMAQKYELGSINHYSRSLEKYALKARTWRTASGEGSDGAARYNIEGFLARNVGWLLDPVALRHSCQLRELLREVTGQSVYLRPGSFWYRNPEFGRHVSEPSKRGRYGRPNPEGFVYRDGNPYHYHGERYGETHLQNGTHPQRG